MPYIATSLVLSVENVEVTVAILQAVMMLVMCYVLSGEPSDVDMLEPRAHAVRA